MATEAVTRIEMPELNLPDYIRGDKKRAILKLTTMQATIPEKHLRSMARIVFVGDGLETFMMQADYSETTFQAFGERATQKNIDAQHAKAFDSEAVERIKAEARKHYGLKQEPEPTEEQEAAGVPFSPSDACWCQPFDGPMHPQCPMHRETRAETKCTCAAPAGYLHSVHCPVRLLEDIRETAEVQAETTGAHPPGAPGNIWIQYSDTGKSIRKWDAKTFDKGIPYAVFSMSEAVILRRALLVLQYASDDALDAVPAKDFPGGVPHTEARIASMLERIAAFEG